MYHFICHSKCLVLAIVFLTSFIGNLHGQSHSAEQRQQFGNEVQEIIKGMSSVSIEGAKFRLAGGKQFFDKNDYLMLGLTIEIKKGSSTSKHRIKFYRYDNVQAAENGVKAMIKSLKASTQVSKTLPVNDMLKESGELKIGSNSFFLGRRTASTKSTKYPIHKYVSTAQNGRWIFQVDADTTKQGQTSEFKTNQSAFLKAMVDSSKDR